MNFVSRKTIVKKLLESKKFRDSYVSENIKRMIPFNLRTMRDERGWSQHEAGQAIGKPQNVISRLESPAYGKLTLQTLLEIAHGYDVGLLIKFVPFSRLVKELDDVSALALSAKSVSDEEETRALHEWAERGDEDDIAAKTLTHTGSVGQTLATNARATNARGTASSNRILKVDDRQPYFQFMYPMEATRSFDRRTVTHAGPGTGKTFTGETREEAPDFEEQPAA